jgi:histidinol phosphatase-like enzyme
MTAPLKAVFLDRDGVINATVVRRGKPRAPQDLPAGGPNLRFASKC